MKLTAAFFSPSRILRRNHRKLGDVRGKTIDEILAVLGQENELEIFQEIQSGVASVRKWRSPRYEVELAFDEWDVCLGTYDIIIRKPYKFQHHRFFLFRFSSNHY